MLQGRQGPKFPDRPYYKVHDIVQSNYCHSQQIKKQKHTNNNTEALPLQLTKTIKDASVTRLTGQCVPLARFTLQCFSLAKLIFTLEFLENRFTQGSKPIFKGFAQQSQVKFTQSY